MAFELNPEQQSATKAGSIWYKKQSKQTFEISGPAGTGKTTIVREITKSVGLETDQVLYMAFVGKATQALARNGLNAKTIHSTIYETSGVPKKDENGDEIIVNGRPVLVPTFKLKDHLNPKIKLLVVDEGGMLDEKIAKDVLSFGIPVIILGDLDQLPPIFGDSYFLKNPDALLTQIMRQNEGNPIIHISKLAREGRKIDFGEYGPNCRVRPYDAIDNNVLTAADIIICAKNDTRENINSYVRETVLGRPAGILMNGDKLVCRQNNWRLKIDNNINLINGMIGHVSDIYLDTYNKNSICIDFTPDFTDEAFSKVRMDHKQLFASLTSPEANGRSYFNKFQYAYALTCHLTQGSQYPHVMVYKEDHGFSGKYQRKWLYTAVTRAERTLDLFMPNPYL